jgi:DNA-binding NtrC family response regulator
MLRAIIIEPDESIRKLQRLILRQNVHADEIVEKFTVDDAMPVFTAEHFDFTMVDISRPTEKLNEFLYISKKRQKTPVIAFTTGELTRETLKLLVDDHVFAVFPKPFEVAAVASSVNAAVEAARKGTLHPTFHGFLEKLHR